jgi:hypothetical protein
METQVQELADELEKANQALRIEIIERKQEKHRKGCRSKIVRVCEICMDFRL